MKPLLLFLLIVVVALMAYQKQDLLTGAHALEASETIENPKGNSAESPDASAKARANAAALRRLSTQDQATYRELQQLAPEEFYTRTRLSETRENGIVGIPKATKVRRVKQEGSSITIVHGSVELQATEEQLTQDPMEILELLKSIAQN